MPLSEVCFGFRAGNDKSSLSQDGKVVLGGPGSFYWQGTKAARVTGRAWQGTGIREGD